MDKLMCFCYSHLTDIQIQNLKEGKPIICSICKKLMWIENGKLQTKEAHKIPQKK